MSDQEKKGTIKNMNESEMFGKPNVETFTLPSNKKVSIRERNGEDEDVLSKLQNNTDGLAFDLFLQAIIIDYDGKGRLTLDEVRAFRIRDKYYLLYKSRVQSLGKEIEFKHTFQGTQEPIFFTEDLSIFDADLSKELLGDLRKEQIHPYATNPADNRFSFTISSGKECRMEYLTSFQESKVLEKETSQLSINEKLRIRSFELKDSNGVWRKIERFNLLLSKEMIEIRKKLEEFDSEFGLLIKIKHPNKGMVEEVSLFLYEDFFFPGV